MDDLDRAILCCSTDPTVSTTVVMGGGGVVPTTVLPPSSPQLIEAATRYINQVKSSTDGWKLCSVKLFQTELDQITFFCFQVLQEVIQKRYNELQIQEKVHVRSCLLTYMNQKLCNPQLNISFYIRNKFAFVLVLLFKADFPQNWSTFFDDLLAMVNNNTTSSLVVDMFLRVMRTIDQEIVSREVQKTRHELDLCASIKDFMRDKCLAKIVETWYNILVKYHLTNPDLAQMTLENIKLFIGWIDINLVVNEHMLTLFFKLLSFDNLREHVMDCLYEIMNKGMNIKDKLALIATLQLKQLIDAIPISNDENNIDFMIKIAKLVNLMGTISLEARQSYSSSYSTPPSSSPTAITSSPHKADGSVVLNDSLELMFKYINHKDDEVSSATIPFANLYIQLLKKLQKEEQPFTEQQITHLQLFLQIIAQKLAYDDDFNFEKRDEYEDDFIQYRKELDNLFKSITQLHPALVGTYVQSSIATILQIPNLDQADTYKLEVTLHLFWKMGEGLPEPLLQQTKDFFVKTIVILAQRNIASHHHRVITATYFDIILRYSRFLSGSEVLQSILVSLLDQRGVRNPHPAIRAKCCDIFMRLAKTLKQEFIPMLGTIVASIKDLVTFGESSTSSSSSLEDSLNLFEGLGLLIGYLASQNSPETESYIETLLKPLIDHMRAIIVKELYKQDTSDNPRFTNWLCELIQAIGTFSKGFTASDKVSTSSTQFTVALQLILNILHVLPNHPLLKSRAMFFMHRMMQCLGSAIFSYLPTIISVFMVDCGIQDLIKFIILINQLLSTFKEKVGDVMDKLFLPLITQIFQIFTVSTQITPKSQEEREMNDLKRNYYQLLFTIVTNNLASVLISSTNVGQFNEVLQTLLVGCRFHDDPNIQKLSFSILRKLVMLWAGTNIQFTKFVVDVVVPVAFEVPWDPRFNLADGVSVNILLVEICGLIVDIYTKCGTPFVEYLRTTFLPSLNCTQQFITAYMTTLLSRDSKEIPRQLRTHIKTYLLKMRGNT